MSTDNSPQTPQEQSRQLQQRVNELIELLRTQREVLKRQGMNLPSGSLDNLRTLKNRVDNLSKQLGGTFVELQSLRALAETTALINSTLETDVVLNQVMDTVINLTGAERGYIVLKNRETGELDEFRVARGLEQEMFGARGDDPNANGNNGGRNEFIVSRSIVNEVARSGAPVLTDNASLDERWQGQQSVVGFALRSILAVPLKVRDEVIGVVYTDNRIMAGLFRENDRDLLAAFANQAGVAIENARLFDETRAQITQITEMRDFMNNIFSSIISGIITVDNDGIVVTCNQAAMDILNVEDAVGLHLQQVMPPLDDLFYDILTDVMHRATQHTVELEPHIEGKGVRSWNVIVSPLRDRMGITLLLDDLTEQKAHEAQLAEVKRYLPPALIENIRDLDDISISGQERTITMIATDVRGFTRFSENLQPEELMEIINKYLSLASDGINFYGGIVDKYMGDAVTGFFNTQLNPTEDHALFAVRAAMHIIFDLYELHEQMEEDHRLFYGIGVHTGSAFLGNVGSPNRKEFSAMGEAANYAKTLESNAGPGEVLISEATYALVENAFECERIKLENNKGIEALTYAYKVLRRRKGMSTGALVVDPELAKLLNELSEESKDA